MDKDIKENTPLVTIMMTTYNRAELISEAIDSVLLQTFQEWELLILDDASTDDTANVVETWTAKDHRIIYLPSPNNLGITKNRNRGFPLARGKYIAVLDSDDYWLDEKKLEKQVEFLEEKSDYVLIGTNVAVVHGTDGEPEVEFNYAINDTDIRERLLSRNQFAHSSLLFRRSALDEQPYDETLPIWEDYDLVLRLGKKGKLANLPQVTTAYRKHAGNISKQHKKIGADTHLQIINRYRDSYPNFLIAKVKGQLRKWI